MDTGTWIGIFGASGGVIAAIVAGVVTLRKSRVEIEQARVALAKSVRDAVIEEWRELYEGSQVENKARKAEIAALQIQVIELSTKITKQDGELAALRAQITIRETQSIKQTGEIRDLEKTVAAHERPDAEKVAAALAPKLAESVVAEVNIKAQNVVVTPAKEPIKEEKK